MNRTLCILKLALSAVAISPALVLAQQPTNIQSNFPAILQGGPAGVNVAAPMQSTLPPPPKATKPVVEGPAVFGSQLFTGAFAAQTYNGFNPDYQVSVGDQVRLRMWGAFVFDSAVTVDPQGNVFIPNVGPVRVAGVRNGDLNRHVAAAVGNVYRSNVGVYASLEAAQPVKVFVTGFVRSPGLYGGLSSDSVLNYLDKAGGVDPDRGSYLEVSLMRSGKERGRVNLYDFLLSGKMAPVQLQDGDTIVVAPRQHTVLVGGEVLNPYLFEFDKNTISAAEVLALAKPKPNATHLSIVRKVGTERRSEYHPIAEGRSVLIQDGDEVSVTADKYPGTILVRVEGAHLGEHSLVMPYGSRLKDLLARLQPAPQAAVESAQLYRRSVVDRQREMLDKSLRSLEAYVLTARSATSEEAALRTKEAELILQFIERARSVEPRGQVILGRSSQAGEALLEDGDVLRIPESSSLVMVHGEVLFPNAVVFQSDMGLEEYIRQAGGYTQNADGSRIVVMHQNGGFSEGKEVKLAAGDEIMVLPKVDSKNIEVTRGISQIIYQIAVAAKVVFGL